MHSAPSVRYPIRPSRLAERLCLGVQVAGAACAGGAALGLVAAGGHEVRALGLCAAMLLAGLSGRWHRDRAFLGELAFDGERWSLSGSRAMADADVRVHLDLQRLILLRIEAAGRPRCWLWVDGEADPTRWRDLRRAVHSDAPRSGDRSASASARRQGGRATPA